MSQWIDVNERIAEPFKLVIVKFEIAETKEDFYVPKIKIGFGYPCCDYNPIFLENKIYRQYHWRVCDLPRYLDKEKMKIKKIKDFLGVNFYGDCIKVTHFMDIPE